MDAGLHLTDAGEDAQRPLLDAFRQAGFFHDFPDLAQVALRGVIMGMHIHLGGAETVFGNLADVQVEIIKPEFGEFGLEAGGRQSGVDQRAEQHVAAGTGDAIDVGGFHGLGNE